MEQLFKAVSVGRVCSALLEGPSVRIHDMSTHEFANRGTRGPAKVGERLLVIEDYLGPPSLLHKLRRSQVV